MYEKYILKKLNFENDNYYLSYCVRPVANMKVVKRFLSEETKNNLILKFKKDLIGESKTKLFFNFLCLNKLEKN